MFYIKGCSVCLSLRPSVTVNSYQCFMNIPIDFKLSMMVTVTVRYNLKARNLPHDDFKNTIFRSCTLPGLLLDLGLLK